MRTLRWTRVTAKMVGSLMWIANQTRRKSPTQYGRLQCFRMTLRRYLVHVKAVRKIIEYLSAMAHLGLTFRKDSKLKDAQLEYDLEMYVDADYAHKACLLYTSPSPRD